MLNATDNDLLTSIEGDAPMGQLLRRYWHPIAALAELNDTPTKRVRIFGEDLVLYKDLGGNLGLLAEACPHRRASLAWGMPEESGLRCMYHGWCFDSSGRCTDQPNEPAASTFANRVTTQAYPVQAYGGLVFGYFGPAPAPNLPRWDILDWNADDGKHIVKQIGAALVPCNWLQIMENSVDPIHAEWLHGNYSAYVAEREGNLEKSAATKHILGGRHKEIGFDRFEWGIVKRRIREGQTKDNAVWRIGHPLLFPNILKVGGNGRYELQYRIPVDDSHTWHIWYQVIQPPSDVAVPRQSGVPYYDMPFLNEKGAFIVNTINGQDIMAWVTQGPVTDRTIEHLGTSDKGVILYRRVLKEQLVKLQAGEDPLGVTRGADLDTVIELPIEEAFRDEIPRRLVVDAFKDWRTMNTPEVQQVIDAIV